MFFHVGDFLAGVDGAVAVGPLGGLPEVVFADLFEIGAGALFDAVFGQGVEAGDGEVGVEVENDGQVGPGFVDGDFGYFEDFFDFQAGGALVGEC